MKREVINEIINQIKEMEEEKKIPKTLVKVAFEDGLNLSYFCDIEGIKVGDVVSVEGKLEGQLAVVKKVLKTFKTPKFKMQWIKAILDADISGEYFRIDNDMISTNCNLTVEKFFSLYVGKDYKEGAFYGEDNVNIDLANLDDIAEFDNELVKKRGKELFRGEYVPFIYLKDGVGKAVCKSQERDEWYEIDFRFKGGVVTYLVCDCPYFDNCKHEYAFLLKLKDTIKKLEKYNNIYNFVLCRKGCFNYILSVAKGSVKLVL